MQNKLPERSTLVADTVWKVHISFLWLSWRAEGQRRRKVSGRGTKLKCRAQNCISHIRELIPSEGWVAVAEKEEKFLGSSSRLKPNMFCYTPSV